MCIIVGIFCFILAAPKLAKAQDTLASVLQQTAKQTFVGVSFREVKHMVFLQDAIETSGRILISGKYFVLEQLHPERQLMTADQHRFRFYIPAKHIRHSKMLTSTLIQKNMLYFQSLITGDQKALKAMFHTHFISLEDHTWTLDLTPKDAKRAPFASIHIKGKSGQGAHYSDVIMPNHSHIEWFFTPDPTLTEKILFQLIHESKG